MGELFLMRVKEDDRDCCKYIDDEPLRWERNHFGCISLHGSCFSGFSVSDYHYEDVETVLTKKEYEALVAYSKEIENLGYGIKKGNSRYQLGLELARKIQSVYKKLKSKKARDFQQKIIEEEIKYLKDRYYFSDDDIEKIFNEYSLEYKDRSIIGCVFSDTTDLGESEADAFLDIPANLKKYFDYEKFGEDLLEDERYIELDDGRIVEMYY